MFLEVTQDPACNSVGDTGTQVWLMKDIISAAVQFLFCTGVFEIIADVPEVLVHLSSSCCKQSFIFDAQMEFNFIKIGKLDLGIGEIFIELGKHLMAMFKKGERKTLFYEEDCRIVIIILNSRRLWSLDKSKVMS